MTTGFVTWSSDKLDLFWRTSGTNVSFTAPNQCFDGDSSFGNYSVDDVVTISGTTGGINDGAYTISFAGAGLLLFDEQTITTQTAGPTVSTVVPMPITAGEEMVLRTGTSVSPGALDNSLQVLLTYEAIDPDGTGDFKVGCVIEAFDDNEDWVIMGYDFTPWSNSGQPKRRIIQISPNIQEFNPGIVNSVWPVASEYARINAQHGRLNDQLFRIKILLQDNDPTGPNPFKSVTLSCSGQYWSS